MTAYDRVREQRSQARRELADLTDRVMLAVTLVQAMRCDCYQPDLAEWAPDPCPRCVLLDVLTREPVTA